MRFPNRIGSSAKPSAPAFAKQGFSATQKTQDSGGISPVRLGNRTYRAWRMPKLTLMGTVANHTYRVWCQKLD